MPKMRKLELPVKTVEIYEDDWRSVLSYDLGGTFADALRAKMRDFTLLQGEVMRMQNLGVVKP